MEFVSTKKRSFDIFATTLNSTQQPGSIFMATFFASHFDQMASDKPFNYNYSGL